MAQDTELNCQNCYNLEINGGKYYRPPVKADRLLLCFNFRGKSLVSDVRHGARAMQTCLATEHHGLVRGQGWLM